MRGREKAPLGVRLALAGVILAVGAWLYVATAPRKTGPPPAAAPSAPAAGAGGGAGTNGATGGASGEAGAGKAAGEAEPVGGWQQTAGQHTAAAAEVEHEGSRQPLAGAPLAAGDVVTFRLRAAAPTVAFVQLFNLDAEGRARPVPPAMGERAPAVQLSPDYELPTRFAATATGATRGFLLLVATGEPPTAAELQQALKALPAGQDGGWSAPRPGGWVEAHRLDAP